MTALQSQVGYPAIDKWLHWGMAALFLWAFVSRWIVKGLPEDHAAQFSLIGLHSTGGFLIFVLGLWRIYRRWRKLTPALPESTHWLVRLAAKANHAALYAMMVVQPTTGFLAVGASAAGLSQIWPDLHVLGSYMILGLLSVHVGAALCHAFILRDDILRRVLF